MSPWPPAASRSRSLRVTSPAIPAQFSQTITTTASDTSAPVITAALADDTGVSSTDGITFDPTIKGVVDDPSGVASFQAAIDGGGMVDVTSLLSGVGFTLTAANLATLNGGTPLADGLHTLLSAGGRQPGPQVGGIPGVVQPGSHAAVAADELAFDRQRPDRHEHDRHEGPLAHGRALRAVPGSEVTLYMNGTVIGQQTAGTAPLDFVVPGTLADGQYLFTATAVTVSGLASPFSNPFTVTVDNSPPPITSFGLDSAFRRTPVMATT